jgi:hypothetical protein
MAAAVHIYNRVCDIGDGSVPPYELVTVRHANVSFTMCLAARHPYTWEILSAARWTIVSGNKCLLATRVSTPHD